MRGSCFPSRQRQDGPPEHLVGQHHPERGRSLENIRIRFLPTGDETMSQRFFFVHTDKTIFITLKTYMSYGCVFYFT